jgi:GT2 family glycosyltransferase
MVERLNTAIAACRAPFVHVLASGCAVDDGWADAALARFGDRRLGSVSPLALCQDGGRVFAAGIKYRSSGARELIAHGEPQLPDNVDAVLVGPPIFAGFYRKAALDFLGGFSRRLGLPQADADMGLMLKQAGFTTALECKSRVWCSTEVDPRESAWRSSLHAERLFWRNLPKRRLGAVLSHAGSMAAEGLYGLATGRVLAQLAGRTVGFLGSYARHRAALAELGSRAISAETSNENVRVDAAHGLLGQGGRPSMRSASPG